MVWYTLYYKSILNFLTVWGYIITVYSVLVSDAASELGSHCRRKKGGLHLIRSQSRSVVKCSEVENGIVLFSGCPSEEAFKESVQHHMVFYSSALREALIFPQGCLVAVSSPEVTSGEFTSKEPQQPLKTVSILLTELQNKPHSSGKVREDEERCWLSSCLLKSWLVSHQY